MRPPPASRSTETDIRRSSEALGSAPGMVVGLL